MGRVKILQPLSYSTLNVHGDRSSRTARAPQRRHFMSLSSSSVGALARAGSGPLGRPPSGAWRPGSPSGWKPWAAREVNNWPSSEQGGRDDAFLRPDTKCDASSWPEQPGSPARLLRALAPASQPPRPPVVAPGIKSKAIIRTCLKGATLDGGSGTPGVPATATAIRARPGEGGPRTRPQEPSRRRFWPFSASGGRVWAPGASKNDSGCKTGPG